MHPVIEEIYREADDALLESAISPDEGALIQSSLAKADLRKTIEIGCANGLSSLYICDATAGREEAHHTILDPFQTEVFDKAGVKNVEKAGFTHFELLEEFSELTLPRFVQEGRQFDWALIDGFHTFDQTLVDFFYINRLVRVGGVVVVDDVNMPSVHHVVRYIATYPGYRVMDAVRKRGTQRKVLNAGKRVAGTVLRPLTAMGGDELSHELLNGSVARPSTIPYLDDSTMVAFEKTAEDNRGSTWFEYF